MTRQQLQPIVRSATASAWCRAAVALALLAGPLGLAATQAATPPAGEAEDVLPAEAASGPAVVEGFRSATFGMDENAVRRAIHADFQLSGNEIARWRNDLEQTTVLSVTVPDLIPDAGTVVVSYVLGRSGRLIQVTLLWGSEGPAATRTDMEAAAALLIAALDERGFEPEVTGAPVAFADGSNLLYYARDEAGGGVALSALPSANPDAAAIMRLAYTADLDNPDVFRAPGIRP
jgi:hypothetical protein